MGITEVDVEKAALLHDIGKLIQRAEANHRQTHAAIGEEFLRRYFTGARKEILHGVAYHHYKELGGAGLPPDDISYIVYEADNLASAADRRAREENAAGDNKKTFGFNAQSPLYSIFDVFDQRKAGADTAYPIRGLGHKAEYPYPVPALRVSAPAEEYRKMEKILGDSFGKKSPAEMTVAELLQVLSAAASYIPSSTNTAEIPDVSLYDHVKLTAAFAVCMWQYFQAHQINDYRKECFEKESSRVRNQPMYLLVSGDLSGIQKFIYTIPSKGALKSLRGRSLYLELLVENIVDEILDACQVSRSCLLYTGGGHFYMMLPNTDGVESCLESFQKQLQEWFLEYYGNRLYMALAWEPCSAVDFMQEGDGAGMVFRKVSRALGKAKMNRYSAEQLEALFTPGSQYTKLEDGERECAICHTSTAHLEPYGEPGNGEVSETEACASCNGLYRLGKEALSEGVFYVGKDPISKSIPLPGFGRSLYLRAVSQEKLEKMPKPERIYTKNEILLGSPVATHLWMGDYTCRNAQGTPVEFAELAQESGGNAGETGIERIGILRADVDNLGAAFIGGLPREYDTLSRKAALSRTLSLFFKRYLNGICQGILPQGVPEFTLFSGEQKKERKVHIIYSGGDDVFLAGTWDDIIETAVDLRHAFCRYTNGKLTFSAGIGFFKSSFPISQMARKTEELENYAKQNPGKNSVSLFGQVVRYKDQGTEERTARYTWDEFEQGVCREKLWFLETHFDLKEDARSNRLFAGKGALYRMLGLMRGAEENHLNLARFAYVLARMEPRRGENNKLGCYHEVRNQFYQWYQNTQDRQQLITAIELLVYRKRDKQDKGVEAE